MKLDYNNSFDLKIGIKYHDKLISNKSKIELKEVKQNRTIKQNSYLHVIINLYAIEFGWTLEEAKTHLKRVCNFMTYNKNDELFLRRTRDLDTKQLTDFIEWIRDYSSLNGCYLPSPEEYKTNRFEIDKTIDNHKQYL
jgi:hypothetical protein